MSGASARRAAAELLVETLDRKRTLDEALDTVSSYDGLKGPDRGFARAMASASLRQLGRIDTGLSPFLQRPLDTAGEATRALLRVGAAQIWLMDVAPHAAVGETVAAAKAWPDAARAAGFINAVLRRASETRGAFDAVPATGIWPAWLATLFAADLGSEAAERLAQAQMHEPLLHLTPKTDAASVAQAVGGEVSPFGGVIAPGGAVEALPGYDAGDWWVQDAAAALPARLLDLQPGEPVLDLCAAPGGKTLQLAAAGAVVTALDRSRPRLKRLRSNLERTGLDAEVIVATVEDHIPPSPPAKILLDAPCSALGTLRRHPEGAWIKAPQDLASFPDVQARLLRAARDMAADGSTIIYCVCTPLKREGEAVVQAVLKEGGLTRAPFTAAQVGAFAKNLTAAGDLLTVPGDGPSDHDAFYIARLVKAAKQA
ncbi:MAG: RsmB/NOP family class I SAM-dependent RNA methyltransferase [Pseudomonadota bacterium]